MFASVVCQLVSYRDTFAIYDTYNYTVYVPLQVFITYKKGCGYDQGQ